MRRLMLCILLLLIALPAWADVAGTARGDSCSVNGTPATDFNFLDNLYIDWNLNAGSSPDDITAIFNYAETLAGNPALGAEECVFTKDGTGGGVLCEGASADSVEGIIVFNPTSSDKTVTIQDATTTLVGRDTTDTLTNKTMASADNEIHADDAVALASNPSDCSAGQYATTIAASGNLSCSQVAASQVSNTPAGNVAATTVQAAVDELDTEKLATTGNAATATALASNPTDCSSNQFANAIAASGNLTCSAISDADVPDTITASNYLPLTGGTLTGLLTTDNLGVEWDESDTNPTCAAGNYNIFADLSETALKACNNGTASKIATFGDLIDANIPDTITINAATALASNPSDCSAGQYATTIAANGNLTCAQVTGAQVANTPAGNLAATDAQAAINELDTEKVAKAGDTLTGNLLIDNQKEIRLLEADANGSNYIGFNAPSSLSGDLTLTWNITASTCTGDGNGGALTINGSNQIVCSADDGGAGGSGDITDVGSCGSGACATEGGTDIFPLIFEGTANNNETTITATDPTGDNTITFPDAGGNVVLDSATQTLTNKTLAAADNVIEADTGDSATSFFSTGTIEDDRLSSTVTKLGQTISFISPAEIVDECSGSQSIRRNSGDTAWECFTPAGGSSFTINANIDPNGAVTDWIIYKAATNLTVTGIDCFVDAATSVQLTVRECNANGASCGNIEATITCGTTNTTEASGIDDSSIAAGNTIRVTRGTVSGTPTQAFLSIEVNQ